MKQSEVPFAGVYRLTVGPTLIGEFKPSPTWSAIYAFVQGMYPNEEVNYTWVPFLPVAEQAEFQPVIEALAELEYHIPVKADASWITCSCKHTVKPSYWTRHATGADGSAVSPKPLERVLTAVAAA